MSCYYRSTRRSSLLSHFLVAVVGAVLGAFLVAFVFPSYLPGVPGPGEWTGVAGAPAVNEEQPADFTPSNVYSYPSVQAVEKAAPSVVGIINKAEVYDYFSGRKQVVERGSGSGVIIGEDGYVVTNYHVVENASELMVVLPGGEDLQARVIGVDPPTDIAVLKVNKNGLKSAEFGNSDDLMVGEPVLAIGNPVDMEFQRSVTGGLVSGLNRKIQYGERVFFLIQTDAVINPGNSGGPLVNMEGKVVGINTLKLDLPKVEGMGFSIPSNTVKRVVDELMKHGKVVRPWLGVGVVAKNTAAVYGIEFERGLYVGEVPPGGPAAIAGIREGDIILEMDGREVNEFAELRRIIESHKVGDVVQVSILRERERLTLPVTLKEMPAS